MNKDWEQFFSSVKASLAVEGLYLNAKEAALLKKKWDAQITDQQFIQLVLKALK